MESKEIKEITTDKKIITDEDYINELQLNQLQVTFHYHHLEYEGEKTDHGEAVIVTDVKKNDLVIMYKKPCYIVDITISKRGVWIVGRCVFNHLECDIVFKPTDLIEKLSYTIYNGIIIKINDAYATIKLDKTDKEITAPMPSSEKEHAFFEKIKTKFDNKEEVKVEVLETYNTYTITRLT